MMTGGYDALARVYDKLNRDVDHGVFADFYEDAFRRFGKKKIESVLDLGCGTGSMTLELARRGYDMTGLDASDDMLAVAHERAADAGISSILWLGQDMTAFDLYGTVDAAVSCLDCVNHLTTNAALDKCFSLVHLFLEPGGLFLFDVNTPRKFRESYALHDYVLEDEGAVCAWRNDFREKSGICDFWLTVFEEQPDGSYLRRDTVERERLYTMRQLRAHLEKAGFEVLGFFSADGKSPASEADERWQVAARALK